MSGVPLLDPPSSPLPLSWWRRLKDKSLSRRGSFARSFPRLHSGRLEKRSRFSGTYNTGQCAQRPQVARSKPGQCFNPCVFQTRATLRQSINSPDICCPPRSTFVQSARLLSAFSAATLNRDLIPPSPSREVNFNTSENIRNETFLSFLL